MGSRSRGHKRAHPGAHGSSARARPPSAPSTHLHPQWRPRTIGNLVLPVCLGPAAPARASLQETLDAVNSRGIEQNGGRWDDQKGSQQFGVGQILGETVAENTWAGNRDRYDCSSAVSSLSGPPTPRRRGARAELDACWRCYGLSESHRGHCHESSWRNPTTGTLLSAQHAVWDTQKLNNSNNGPPTPTGNRLASNLVTCAEGFPSRGGAPGSTHSRHRLLSASSSSQTWKNFER